MQPKPRRIRRARSRPQARPADLIQPLESRRLMSASFETAVPIPLSSTPTGDPAAPVVTDFDNDGDLDVVVAFPAPSAIDTGYLQVGLGDGSGTFAFAAAIDVGRFTGRPVVGDFDGDGLYDLAVADGFGGQVKVLRNASDPAGTGGVAFAPAVAFPAGVSPEPLAVGDLNADGRADLAVGNRSDNTVQVRLGAGSPTAPLGAAATLNTGTDPATLAVGDFTLDGNLDVLVGASGGTDSTTGGVLQVFAGNGDGTLNPAPIATAGPRGVTAVGDINGDQAPDVIVGVTDQDVADALVNNGNGTFTLTPGSTGSTATKTGVLADLDENDVPDLLTAVGGRIDVLSGNGEGGFGQAVSFDAAGGSGPAVADVTGDGRPDVLTVTATPGTATGRTMNVSVGRRFGPDLTVQILSPLPTSVILGAKGKVTLRVTNNGPEAVNQQVPVQLVGSTDATVDDLDPLFRQQLVKLNLKPGRSKTVKLAFNYEADAGTYTLTARVDPQNATGDLNPFDNSATAPTALTIAQPFIDFSGAIPAAPPATIAAGAKAAVNVVVTNAGNTLAAGRLDVALTASPDATPDATDTVLRITTTSVRIAPGKTKTVKFRFKMPDLAAGSYYFISTVDSGDTVSESDETNNTGVSPSQVTVTAAP
ncbi:MAG: alkaline phosphatase [Phycisphaerales bacterium]|nr:alkaline phosphatase [Phycisphaerales bacterium]